MDFPENIKIFLKKLPLKDMSGQGVLCAIVFFLSGRDKQKEISISEIRDGWSKTLIKKTYNSIYVERAQGLVHSCAYGKVCITEGGISYIESLLPDSFSKQSSHLMIFNSGETHSFDKFLRSIFKKSKKTVDIADTWVDGNIFDRLLDQISNTVQIRFLYTNDAGGFENKKDRFAKEYNFQNKKVNNFHDRFIVVDGVGYIIGPSLKDAADKKPAIVVALSQADSQKLQNLFNGLWSGN